MSHCFVPGITNPYHEDYSRFDSLTKDIAKDVVLHYWSQGGTDYDRLEPWMIPSFVATCEAIDDRCKGLWEVAWKAARNAPRPWPRETKK